MTSKTLRDLRELREAGLLRDRRDPALQEVAARYAVAITPAIAELIDASDPADPIARQFVPSAAEMLTSTEETDDPIGDNAHSPVEGIVHRYSDRVLLKLVHVCPVYCRFCFRREMVGPGKKPALTRAALDKALAYIAENETIWEVILTGGDPLILSPPRLKNVVAALAAIAHVKIVRVHTRVPVVAPERVTRDLVRALRTAGLTTYVVVHVNHARELTDAAREASARLVDAGIPILSQSVSLKGVNDDAASLEQLMRTLVECRVKPYYLHHADLAPGTSHFRTSVAKGQQLMRDLRKQASGLCQPMYVLDIPGGAGKVPIGPCYIAPLHGSEPCAHMITDENGAVHRYPSK